MKKAEMSGLAERATRIIRACATAWNVSPRELLGVVQTPGETSARHAAFVLLVGDGWPVSRIAQTFKRCDSTVRGALNSHKTRMSDPVEAAKFKQAKEALQLAAHPKP